MDLAVAILFITVGLPVIGGLLLAAFREYLQHRSRANTLEVQQLRQRVQELERRVEVLETLIGSPEFQLFRERMQRIQQEAARSFPAGQSQLAPTPPVAAESGEKA